jgi:calcineurin-like phosphoesterase family protein
MPSPWTQEEIAVLQNSIQLSTADLFVNFLEAFPGTKRTYDSVQKKIKQLRQIHVADDQAAQTFQPEDLLTDSLLDETLEEELFVPSDQVEKKVAEWLFRMEGTIQGRKSVPVTTGGASLVIVLSDNHFGKKTSDFNLEVAKQRVLSIPQSIIDAHGHHERVDEVVLVLAGDEVEGEDIYSNQNGSLECPVIYQAKAACEAYWELALSLHETFGCKVRIVTCPGNHGRMSKTADTRSNWDNVVYMMLGLLAQQNPELEIEVDLNFDEFALFEVKGKLGCAYHYGTKHLGTPAMTQKMAGWVLSKGIDFLVHGHWHHWGVETYLGRPMMHNGCMCGPDDLAEKMAVEEPPRQGYFFVERDKPIRTFSFVEW